MTTYINYIEKIYESINIHRAIIIVNDNNIEKIEEELIKNNHMPIRINNNSLIDYDYRLFLLTDIELISKFEKNSYNLIINFFNNY
jgi:hypothetical protein